MTAAGEEAKPLESSRDNGSNNALDLEEDPAQGLDEEPSHLTYPERDNFNERNSAPTPPSFRTRHNPSQSLPPSEKRNFSHAATRLYTLSNLVFFSLWGTLARLGVQWLTFYSGAPIATPVLWANVGGSFIMGFLTEDARLFRQEWGDAKKEKEHIDKKAHIKAKKTMPLYIGLTTGFCGSFTSFSSFERDVFLALANNLPTPVNHPYDGISVPSFTSTIHRNGGYSFMALLAIIIYTICLSLAALKFGEHCASALDRFTPSIPFNIAREILDPLIVFLAWGCWLGAVFLSIWPPHETWRGEVLFALVFAPVGCLLRWYASAKLNPISTSFPLGTFAVNVFGCAVEAMCYSIQHVPILATAGASIGGGRISCQVLQGIQDGFCGCTTTISTFVSELQSLRRKHAYVYGLASVVAGLCIMVIIMGSVKWSIGWSSTACVTMRTSL